MSCVSSATSTQFATFTSNSASTSFSSSLTTLPGSVTTISSTSCLESSTPTGTGTDAASPTCISSTVIESASTIAGSVSTVQVPFVTTVPVTLTRPTATLFGSSCSTLDSSPTGNTSPTSPTKSPTSPATNSPTNSPTSPTANASSSSSSSTTNPPPTGFTTVTSIIQGSTVIQVVPNSSIQPDSNSNAAHSSSNVGPILGGIFGGVVGLVLFVGLIWWILRRRNRWDDIFDEKEGYENAARTDNIRPAKGRGNMLDTEFAADSSTEPRPYEYGLVGAARPLSPPSENLGVRPVSLPPAHSRNASDAPLLMGNLAVGPTSSTSHLVTPSSTSHASHPSAGSSSYFLPGQPPTDAGHSPRQGTFAPNATATNPAPNVNVPLLPSPPVAAASVIPSAFGAHQLNASTHDGLGSPTTRTGTIYEGSPPQQHRTLFVANQLDGERAASPPIAPHAGNKRESLLTARNSGEIGTSTNFSRPLSPQRQSTSPVLVHKDAGRVSNPPTATGAGNDNASAPSGSGNVPPPPAYTD